jgi:hypothetical protein
MEESARTKLDIVNKLRCYVEDMVLDEVDDQDDFSLKDDEDTEDNYFANFACGFLSYVDYEMGPFLRPVHPSDFNWKD